MGAQPSRSETTRQALIEAAEKLVADKGIENVSIRKIVSVAGQKNESALQYHFRNLQGLIAAIHDLRSAEIQAKRTELLAELAAKTPEPVLRDLCIVMVMPIFLLAKSKPGFRRYIKAFGHEVFLSEESALKLVDRKGGGGESGRQMAAMLRANLEHLDEPGYRRRMEVAVRLVSASLAHHSRQKSAFRGVQADLFVSNLIDLLVGLLSVAESTETRALVKLAKGKARG